MTDAAPRRLAAIDIGTVTTRLLVAEVCAGAIREIARSTDITHLGENLTRTGRLSSEAMGRAREVIARYARALDEYGVDAWGAVATSASRDASNGPEFLGRLEQAGIRPHIIDGATEARLTYTGATFATTADDVLVDDIGGGSTELVFGSGGDTPRIEVARSIDIGSRRLTEAYLPSDPPTADERAQAREHVAAQMRSYFDALPRPVREVVSVAGTATSLAAIELGLESYDPERVHGYRLSSASVRSIGERLAGLTLKQRREVVGLHPGRASVIVAGALILEAVLQAANADSTLVSEHDILYGLLLDVYHGGALATSRDG